MNLKKFWKEGVSYDVYLKSAQESLESPKSTAETEFQEYYKLGIQRMNRMAKSFEPYPEHLEILAGKNFKGKVLIITEAWCGDASQAVPVISKFFQQNEVRITYRDQEPSLIDHFLTNGAKAIPVVLLLNEHYEVINTWGTRPQYGSALLAKHKNDPEAYSREQFHNDLQVYYAKNKGFDTIEEILRLL